MYLVLCFNIQVGLHVDDSAAFFFVAVVVSQEWSNQPENVAVFAGSELTLRCPHKSANGSVNWFLYTTGIGGIPMKLTDDSGCLENNSWKYKCSDANRILSFNCTDKTYAGIYECRMSGETTSMHLTILGRYGAY